MCDQHDSSVAAWSPPRVGLKVGRYKVAPHSALRPEYQPVACKQTQKEQLINLEKTAKPSSPEPFRPAVLNQSQAAQG